jgi:4-amino-4-deoxy-L-arabinose transferase-like glycosyltransferase
MTSTSVSTSPTPSPFRILVSAVLVLTFLRVAALATTGLELHGDEAQYWTWAQRLDFGYFTKPPLIAWIIAGATSVCGDAAWCVRLPSPILHGLTALAVFWLTRAVFRADSRADWIGLWAGAIWITLPAVAYSALLVSTDVPLLLCWTVFLAAWRSLVDARSGREAWLLVLVAGLALGTGLLAKYAMAYALIGIALHMAVDRDARALLRSVKLPALIGIGLLVLSANLIWNLQNEFATVRHLGDNANLKGELFHPLTALEFLGQQFGVFGPVPFAILIWRVVALVRGQASRAEKFLLVVTLPPLAVVTAQAVLSRANANWAVTAYPAATVLVAGWLVTQAKPRLGRWAKGLTLGPHLVAGLALLMVAALWPTWQPPLATKGLAKLAGWEEMAQKLRPVLAQYPDLPVMMDDRMNMAALLYTMRGELVAADRAQEGVPGTPVWAWDWNFCPEHHYEQTSRFDPEYAQPIMLWSGWEDPGPITASFRDVVPVGIYRVTAYGLTRVIRVFLLDRYQGHWTPPSGRLPCEPTAGQGLLPPAGG